VPSGRTGLAKAREDEEKSSRACSRAQDKLERQKIRARKAYDRADAVREAYRLLGRATTVRAKRTKAQAKKRAAEAAKKAAAAEVKLGLIRTQTRVLCARATRAKKKVAEEKKRIAKVLRQERLRAKKVARDLERQAEERRIAAEEHQRIVPPQPAPRRTGQDHNDVVGELVEDWLRSVFEAGARAVGGTARAERNQENEVAAVVIFQAEPGETQDLLETLKDAMNGFFGNPLFQEVYTQARSAHLYASSPRSPDDRSRSLGQGGLVMHRYESSLHLGDVHVSIEALSSMEVRLINAEGKGMNQGPAQLEINARWSPQGTRPARTYRREEDE